jgi:hypothetical protein
MKLPLTRDEIIERHKVLHRSLDELFACFITEHPERSQFLETPIGDMMEWAFEMTVNPTCVDKHRDPNEAEDDETEDTD